MSTLPGEGGSENARNAPQISGGFGLGSPNFTGFPALSFVSRTNVDFNRRWFHVIAMLGITVFSLEKKISMPLKKYISVHNTFHHA